MNILIVDDKPANLLALRKILVKPGLDIIEATSGNDALALLLKYDFALILLDVQMPDMDGFETAEIIRGNEETKSIPIIFVTAISKEQKYIFEGYEKGAVDYLFKPLDPDILQGKVNVFLELHGQKEALKKINTKLKMANKRILEQQETLIEEERVKVLLQMAGAKAYELNQPLAFLVEDIELMGEIKGNPKKTVECINRMKVSGQKLSDIITNINTLHYSKPTQSNKDSTAVASSLDREINILVVDDTKDVLEVLKAFFADQDLIKLSWAGNFKASFAMLKQEPFDMVFLNHILSEGTSIEYLRDIDKEDIGTPVIVVTEHGDEMLASHVIQMGAYEYLPRSRINSESLLRVLNNTLERASLRKDVEKAHAKMAEMSTVDELTKLYNRRYFIDALDGEFERANRYEMDMALIMLDLDYFKKVNDTYGHPAGDMVLSDVGGILKKHIRRSDLACRYGGEEFAVILPNVSKESIYSAYERFREMVSKQTFKSESKLFHITVSVGIAFSNDAESANDLLAHADQALYQAKESGRNRVVIFKVKEAQDN
ncbi:MAG: diguanylate cyclase [Candidatus Scalindua sp.]|jgi:two-component system cell cycle response regulator|nr:diguanylate cyclase [Candidatus Scalindua sp.]MBT5303483.1 diguanylate cyclase [Candidatus Scalindua sp.]MBT6052810.1 diguanylate cyclase [Candidatus Scalindua sp.]MBT6231036.1 diguanylate cyclase [Candidatus Scalindua sp.]MBT6563392.1 diguanylate cyclase [Candidatus Scalindua sp.]